MPQVVKQTAKVNHNQTKSLTSQSPKMDEKKISVLSRIKPVSMDEDGIRLSIYGRSKSGKTRLACTFPKPLLLIGTEKGTKSVSTVKGVDFVQIYKSEEIDQLAGLLREGKYRSAAIDQAGGLQDIILKEILGTDDLPIQRSWGMAQRDQWMACGAQTKERLKAILDLSLTHSLHVVVIAHERNFSEEGQSDLILPTVGSALTPSAAGWLNGACDYICQTYIREEVMIKKTKVGNSEIETRQPTGKLEYCLRVGPHPVYMTGFRLPEGTTLPDSIINPSYEKIAALIRGEGAQGTAGAPSSKP